MINDSSGPFWVTVWTHDFGSTLASAKIIDGIIVKQLTLYPGRPGSPVSPYNRHAMQDNVR